MGMALLLENEPKDEPMRDSRELSGGFTIHQKLRNKVEMYLGNSAFVGKQYILAT